MRAALSILLLLALLSAGCSAPATVAPVDADVMAAAAASHVVIAHVDTGINPYHVAFRDDSPLGYAHPSTFLPGFPSETPALRLSLNETDFATAIEKDAAVWDTVERDTLYWIPGTRIVGAVSFGAGGRNCPPVETPPPNLLAGDCPERVILDDHGHGTMTASRMAAARNSLAPTARIVSVEGLGPEAVRWLADLGWVDVQTNSWLSFVPPPASAPVDGVSTAFAYAAERMATFAASGNGAAYITGFAPTPTYVLDTAAPGVILVGAHDNGRLTAWSGAPPHVVADGYGGWMAQRDSLDVFEPHPIACCSSAASPYAAGGAAALILEARELLGDAGVGLRDGAFARGPEGLVPDGPLADGELTLDELRALLLATAVARPAEGPDDGLLHWAASGDAPPGNVAGNPYCLGCWTAPVSHGQVPADAPLYVHAGYGSVDPTSLASGTSVLRGEAPLPERPAEDDFFALDAEVRRAIFGG